jgi:Tol biopolymer transport system component
MRLLAVSSAAFMSLPIASAQLAAQGSDATTRKIAEIDTGFTYGLAEPKSGRFIVYADSRGIHTIDPRTGKTTNTIDRATVRMPTAYFGLGLSLSASGRRLVFVASGESNSDAHVWSVDLDTLTGKPVSAPHRVSIMPAEAARISDDGKWIALVTSNVPRIGPATRKLLVIPSDGGDERMLDSAGRIQTPFWTPDGKTIYYIRGRGKGPAVARIAAMGGQPDSLASAIAVIGISPDGQRIAYYPPTSGGRAPLRIADPQGRTMTTIPTRGDDLLLAWSRSNPGVLLSKRSQWQASFKTVSLENGKVSPYSLTDGFAASLVFSPNGRLIAAVSIVNDRAQLVVFDQASKQRRVLTTDAEPDPEILRWSPDGSHIAFLALDSTLLRHEIHVVNVATSRSTRLADIGPARASNATLFRWRTDGQSIDYITGTSQQGTAGILERVTLAGARSVIRKLPSVPQGPGGTTSGYRLLNDSLVALGHDYTETPGDSSFLAIVDTRTGATRAFLNRFAYWQLFAATSGELSPDGKWVAFGSGGQKDNKTIPQWAITSLDGKTVRLLGEPMACDAWPVQWLPDSRALLAVGVSSCDPYSADLYVVPIDGTPARRLTLPKPTAGSALTPDGRSLVVGVYDRFSTSLVALDVAKALGANAAQSGKSATSGKN